MPAIAATRFQFLPLREQVRAAHPIAQDIIAASLSADEGHPLTERVIALLDDTDLDRLIDEQDNDTLLALDNRLHAAFAIGLALGLMLRPEAFALDQKEGVQ